MEPNPRRSKLSYNDHLYGEIAEYDVVADHGAPNIYDDEEVKYYGKALV